MARTHLHVPIHRRTESPRLSTLTAGLSAALAAWLGGATPALAITVGAPHTQSALFQPLRLVLPLQLQPGETLNPDCVTVVVVAGETRLPGDQIQVQLQGRTEGEVSAVRVSTLAPIDEPLVTLNLSLGCPTRFTRQFTALIDPPGPTARAEPLPTVPEGDQLYSPALRAALATSGSRASDLLAAGKSAPASAASAAVPEPPVTLPSAAASATTPAATPAAKAPRAPRASKPRDTTHRTPHQTPTPLAQADQAATSSPPPTTRPAARLQLEAPEVLSAPAAPVAASEPRPSAASAAATGAAQERVVQLEAELARMRAESREMKEALKQLTAQLRQSPANDRNWLLMLGGISLLLAVACGWLFLQLQRLRRVSQEAWWAQLADGEGVGRSRRGAPSSASPLVVPPETWPSPDEPEAPSHRDEPVTAAVPAARGAQVTRVDIETDAGQDFLNGNLPPSAKDAPDTVPVGDEAVSLQLLDMPQSNTDLQPLQALPERAAAEGVSVEELIDLEQQVDFFMVLGQHEAAVDLLSQRLHETGRHTALPYLKLLEILQRHGDQGGFERVAQEFSERFHAQAPVWSDDIAAGEGLLAYAQAAELIIQSWRDAAMTMQLIQTLLAHGDPDGHAFNLAAYRDILMLYAVARDISEHEVRGADIDLFLPLDGSHQRSPTSMMATMPWQRPGGSAPMPGPVDLDLDLSGDAKR